MGMVKLPNGKATVDPMLIAGASYREEYPGGFVLTIVWRDTKRKELEVPCETEAEAKAQIDFITTEAGRINPVAVGIRP